MRPLIILSVVFAAACAAPAPGELYAAGYAAAPVAAVHAAAPVAAVHVAPVAAAVPAPYTTSHVAGAPATSLHKAPTQIQKQLHYGSKDFVSGFRSEIFKPAIPDFRIAVPTALKGTHQVNPAQVRTIKEPHVVNEAYPVERRIPVPVDVPVYKEQIVEVPRAVHVDRPYNVAVPTPVRGRDIVQVKHLAPVVNHKHTNVHQQTASVHHAAPVAYAHAAPAAIGYAHHAAAPIAAAGYAAAPAAVGVAHHAAAPIAAAGYAAAPAAVGVAHAAAPIAGSLHY